MPVFRLGLPARAALESASPALPMDAPRVARAAITLGAPALDAVLAGGLARGALHEVYAAEQADLAAATGFAAGLASRAMAGRPLLWVRHDALDPLAGRLHAPGLAEIGLDPADIILVRAPDIATLLRAGGEGARCAALGAVLIEAWGQSKLIDLTATRRLHLAARASGVPVLMLRAAEPTPSAASTRWRIASAPARALPGDAPGAPTWRAELLRHKGGIDGVTWTLEWNRDDKRFIEPASPPPLSGAVVPLGGDRAADPGRRAA